MLQPRKGLLLVCVATQLTCASGLFTAPAGANFTCTANPPFIAAFGDVSVISVLIIEPAGFPVPDGTVAFFFATEGRVDAQAKTKDGVARANFVSDSRSGEAQISVTSGAPAAAPSPPAVSPSPPIGVATGSGTCLLTVAIGSARPSLVKVVANPPRLTNNRCTTITATVFDANGNPVFNVPIIFSVSSPTNEFFQSGGIPIFTDTNGQASDVMCTRRPRDDPQATVTVTATPPLPVPSPTTTVTIN